MPRSTVIEMAMQIALACEARSEDPFNRVGAVALTSDNRIIATAYNGLLPGIGFANLESWLFHQGVIQDHVRDFRSPYMVHAEQNLCSLIKRGEATQCVTTLCPCPSCLLLLACHGIKNIVYLRPYERHNCSDVAKFYGITLTQFTL